MTDCVSFVWYLICSGIVSFFSVRYRTDRMLDSPAFRQFYIYVHGHVDMDRSIDIECSIDMNMQHGHGIQYGWICSMVMDMQNGFGHAAWTLDSGHAWMHGCRNADKKLRKFTTLSPASAFRHHGQSGTAGHGLIR
jgi:hypothetical protein